MVAVERSVQLFAEQVEQHPARLVGASGGLIGLVAAVADPLSPQAWASVGVLTFTLSMVTLIVRALLIVIRGERTQNREMRAQIAAHTAQLADDNLELRHRVAELERRLMDDGR